MNESTKLKITAGTIVKESKLSKLAKLQLFNFIQHEASDAQIKALLLDGKIVKLDEMAEQIVNDRFSLTELGVGSNVAGILVPTAVAAALGGGVIPAADWAIWRLIAAAFSKAHRQCGIFKISEQRDACLAKARINMYQDKIKFLTTSISKCNKHKDPDKCRNSIKKEISSQKINLEKQKIKIKELTLKDRAGEGSDPSYKTKWV